MPDTFVKIASVTVGSGGATPITFSSIPGTYTDLVLYLSSRIPDSAPQPPYVRFNGSTTGYSQRYVYGDGGATGSTSYSGSLNFFGFSPGSSNTANTFGNSMLYIPNYTSSNQKSSYSDGVSENNGFNAYQQMYANLWSGTAAITQIDIYPNGANFVQYTTATLYGIKNS